MHLDIFDCDSLTSNTYISLYYKKISPPPCQESRERGGGGGLVGGCPCVGGGGPGRIVLSPPKAGLFLPELLARNFWIGLKFKFVRSLGLSEVWVCSIPPILGSRGHILDFRSKRVINGLFNYPW